MTTLSTYTPNGRTDIDIDLSKLDRATVLHGVDDVIKSLYETGNVHAAVQVLDAFEKFSDISGFARAKLLWGGQQWFETTHQSGDFYEKFKLKEKNQVTYADRLINLWDAMQSGKLPKKVHEHRTVRELLPISEALSQGYELNDKVMNKLVQAADITEISKIIQKAKGKQPKKSTITLVVDAKGFITAWQDGVAYNAGTLNVTDDAPTIQKAVARIKKNSNILEA